MNTRPIPTTDDEGVSPPYRPPGPMARQMPRPMPATQLRPGWTKHPTVRKAGEHPALLWLYACDVIRERGGDSYLTLTELSSLINFEKMGDSTSGVIKRAIKARFFAKTGDGVLVFTDALDDRRT
jgi:hypothetical protein